MEPIHDLLNIKYFGNTVLEWVLAATVFLITFTVLPLLKSYLMRLAKRPLQASKFGAVTLFLRLIPRTSRIFVLVVALNLAMRIVDFPAKAERALEFLIQVGVWFQVGLWAMTVVAYLLDRKQRTVSPGDAGLSSSLTVINFIAGTAIWAVVTLLALDNMGVDITALVAGLGIGGIAVALAVQTVLGDLLASLSITLDKPFAVGDSLVIDNLTGKVEDIGIRSTRIRSINGEQIIISNADLLKSRVRNFGRMDERRGVINIGITYETPVEKVKRARELIEQAINAVTNVRLDRCHFKELGATSLNFEAVFFVLDPAFDALMTAQQDINFKLLEDFAREGIEFAYPTQKLFLARA
jgi:small-conductance mechanosensitive channel